MTEHTQTPLHLCPLILPGATGTSAGILLPARRSSPTPRSSRRAGLPAAGGRQSLALRLVDSASKAQAAQLVLRHPPGPNLSLALPTLPQRTLPRSCALHRGCQRLPWRREGMFTWLWEITACSAAAEAPGQRPPARCESCSTGGTDRCDCGHGEKRGGLPSSGPESGEQQPFSSTTHRFVS